MLLRLKQRPKNATCEETVEVDEFYLPKDKKVMLLHKSSLLKYVFYIPGSSRYVKFLPFGRFFW